MVKFVPTKGEDRPLIVSWIDADPWHSYKDAADWWITGGYLQFKLVDEQGVTMFVRFDVEGTEVRLHTQFAPKAEVDEKRVAMAISQAIPEFIPVAKGNGVTGIITESSSPKLVQFLCGRLGFQPLAGNDYKLTFSEGQ